VLPREIDRETQTMRKVCLDEESSGKTLILMRVFCLFTLLMAGILTQFNALAAPPPSRITVTYCEECVPFQFTNADGKADGQIIDYWKLWSKKTGVAVQFVPATWNQTLTNVRDGKVDAHAGLFFSDERNTYLDYGSTLSGSAKPTSIWECSRPKTGKSGWLSPTPYKSSRRACF